MSESVRARRTLGLLVLAAVLVLGVALAAPDADAKKKKRINVVQSVTGQFCEGTEGRDRLVGTDESDIVLGKGGKDVYQGNGDGDDPDFFDDTSTTSNDTYISFGKDRITDFGGPADVLDLSSLRLIDEVTFTRSNITSFPGTPPADELVLNGPTGNGVFITDHFGRGRIETIKFANGTIADAQAASLAREATPEVQAALEERLADDEHSARAQEKE